MKKINIYQKLLATFFLGLVVYWVYLRIVGSTSGNRNYWYSFLFGLIPLIGGLVGLISAAGIWGRFKSSLGRSLGFISIGLILWGLGETTWSYYNFFRDVPAPYPSLADIGFAPSIFFWVLGAAFLSHASGAWLFLRRSIKARLFAAVSIIVLSVLSYYLLVEVARDGVLVPEGETVLKTVLDVVYPLGDLLAVIYAFVVFVLSFKYFGGFYRLAVGSILAGLGVMYIGDIVFSYTTTVGSYYNANWGDLILTTGLFLLSFGVLGFATKPVIAANEVDSNESDI